MQLFDYITFSSTIDLLTAYLDMYKSHKWEYMERKPIESLNIRLAMRMYINVYQLA